MFHAFHLLPSSASARLVAAGKNGRTASARGGNTLVAVLVAFVIIGLALALIIPAVDHTRTPARANVCRNNMRNVALATMQFEHVQGEYPALNRRVTIDGKEYNRPLMFFLLPYLERNDIYNAYVETATNIPAGDVGPSYLKILVCLSDYQSDGMPTSYVFNCGLPNTPGSNKREATEGQTEANTRNNGMFFALYSNGASSSAYITENDGMATTLMISENVEAGNWNDGTEFANGFTWHDLADPTNVRINAHLGEAPGDRATNTDWARPASNHRGGVNVAFADVHVTFLNENIDYVTYAQLMTSAGELAGTLDPTVDPSVDGSADANADSKPRIVPPVHVPVHTQELREDMY